MGTQLGINTIVPIQTVLYTESSAASTKMVGEAKLVNKKPGQALE